MAKEFCVIGAGIVGSSIAYHLSKRTDGSVTVYEQHTPGSETTAKSVSQFGYYGDHTQYRMKQYGMQLYNKFFADANANPRYTFSGLLELATSSEGAAKLRHSVENGGERSAGKIAGTSVSRDCVQYFSKEELAKNVLVPPLDEERITGAVYRPRVGYMDRPHELAHEFLERARDNGATVRVNTAVEEITTRKNEVSAVVSEEGTHEVDEVVCAAGPWNIEIADSVGVDLPLEHTIAPAIQLEPTKPVEYSFPVLGHHEGPYSIHRRSPDELLVSYNPGAEGRTVYEPDDLTDDIPGEIREGMIDAVERFTPTFMDADLVDEWVGIRSQTPDGNPVIGWTELDGFSIAASHTSGIQLAPAIGKFITQQLVDGEPGELYDNLSISRFDGYTDGNRVNN